MNVTLLDYSASLAQAHIDELRREGAKMRLAGSVRRRRRERRRADARVRMRPATAR